MNKKFLKLFFSSGVQVISVQVLGVAFFLIISLVMSKDDFGVINWANAIAVTLTIVLGVGIEQVILRRIAASHTSDWAAAAFFFHLLVTSIITFLVLWFCSQLAKGNAGLRYLPWFFAAQTILAIASPFKQYLNAKQKFGPYAVIAIVANVLKLILVYFLVHTGTLTIDSVFLVLIGCATLELVALFIYVRTRGFRFRFRFNAYVKLLKEATPHYIATLFDSSLSRTDWILLGVMATHAITAEYSFAYRAYEIARLPQAMLNPIMLGVFTRMFAGGRKMEAHRQEDINDLFSVEIFFAMFLPLYLNLMWSPLLDGFFQGKYGSVNHTQFLILSACIPLQFFINIMWGLGFSAKFFRPITLIIGITSVINIILNVIFIKWMSAEGAALAYLITTIIQVFCYYKLITVKIMRLAYGPFVGLLLSGVIAYYVAATWLHNLALQLLCATAIYCVLAFGGRMIKFSSIKKAKDMLLK